MELSKTELEVVLKTANDCLNVSTESDMLCIFDQVKEIVPFGQAILRLVGLSDTGCIKIHRCITHGCDKQMISACIDNGLVNADPVIVRTMNTPAPFTWCEMFTSTQDAGSSQVATSDLGQDIVCACCTSGLSKMRTILSLSFRGGIEFSHALHILVVRYLAPHIHHAMWHLFRTTADGYSDQVYKQLLTNREVEVLNWVMHGKTAWEIGRIMSISERTVKFHLRNTYSKLGVVNRSQAIAKALQQQLI